MVAVPAATPLATPVLEPIVATDVLLLAHVPPDELLFKVVVAPAQTFVVPVMLAGAGFTVNMALVEQPVEVNV